MIQNNAVGFWKQRAVAFPSPSRFHDLSDGTLPDIVGDPDEDP